MVVVRFCLALLLLGCSFGSLMSMENEGKKSYDNAPPIKYNEFVEIISQNPKLTYKAFCSEYKQGLRALGYFETANKNYLKESSWDSLLYIMSYSMVMLAATCGSYTKYHAYPDKIKGIMIGMGIAATCFVASLGYCGKKLCDRHFFDLPAQEKLRKWRASLNKFNAPSPFMLRKNRVF